MFIVLVGGFAEDTLSDLSAGFPSGKATYNAEYEYDEDSDLDDEDIDNSEDNASSEKAPTSQDSPTAQIKQVIVPNVAFRT